jgi:C4-dicarboxylate-specific signal transduction histidine kinase
LATILNNTEAMIRRLRSGATEPEYLIEVMEEVADQTSLAGEIVRRIRKFVQKEPPQRKPVLVASLIQDASRLVDFELRKADVDLSIHVDENLPKALVDPIQVEQVLLNLIRNAVDAMSAAPLTDRRIAINAMPGPSEWIEIAVQDSGPGVPNAALDKIFDPFFSTREKGMGLGLAISRTIIESHGGRLWMEPSTKGAMFRFTLPSSSEDLTYDI